MNRVRLIVLLALLLGMSFSPYISAGEVADNFDGAPLAIALAQALNSLYTTDYESAARIASQALNASVPDSLVYLHKKTWTLIQELSNHMLQAEKKSSVDQARVYKLYRYEIELRKILPQYKNVLLNYIYDSSLKFKINKMLEVYIKKLDNVMEARIAEISHSTVGTLPLKVIAPQNVYAGSTMQIIVKLPPGFSVSKIRVILLLTTPILDQSFYPDTNRSVVSVEINIPGAENYTYSYKGNPGKVFVVATGKYNGSTLELFSSSPVNIRAERPRMYFDIPNGVRVNQTLEMTVFSECSKPLIANISIVKPSGEDVPLVWKEVTIAPGRNHFILHTENLNPGLYTLRIHILPRGMYVEALYSKAILIEEPEIKAAVPTVIIGPPFTAVVRLELGDFNSSGVIIVKGAYSANNGSKVDPGAKYLEVNLGWTTLASSKNLTFEFIGIDGRERAQKTARITSINIFSVIALTTFFSMLSSISARGLKVRLERLSRIIGRAARIAGGKASETAVVIYRSLLSKLAEYGLPGESETLREYLHRLTIKLKGTRKEGVLSALKAFIFAYEKYLYSKRKPGTLYLKKLYKELVRKLG